MESKLQKYFRDPPVFLYTFESQSGRKFTLTKHQSTVSKNVVANRANAVCLDSTNAKTKLLEDKTNNMEAQLKSSLVRKSTLDNG